MTTEQDQCAFCKKGAFEVTKLIQGPDGVSICNECVGMMNGLMRVSPTVQGQAHSAATERILPKPSVILKHLDESIIGQEAAKKILSVAVYNHYKRLFRAPETPIQKSNILLVGPTGTGKTLLAQTLATVIDVPFAIADATTLTEAGYVGDDVENILAKLLQNADGDVARAQQGIIYIDEIDKLSRKSESPSLTRDVSGEGVQQALLKIIEGTIAMIPPNGGRKHPQQELVPFDTHQILFICGGAFEGLDKIIERRAHAAPIGFKTSVDKDKQNQSKEVQAEDLRKFGLIPELIGRLPIIASLKALTEEDLIAILTQPKNAITKQFQALFQLEQVELEFAPEALKAIAQKAMKQKTGARGLRSILETLLLQAMFEAPDRPNLVHVFVPAAAIDDPSKVDLIDAKAMKSA